MRWKTETYSGWGRALSATGKLARPERHSALAALCAEEPAPAIGNRRSYGDAPLADGGRAIDMTRLDRVLQLDEKAGTVNVEAGMALGDLLRLLAPRGWLPAILPGTGFATVGGAIANDVHGKNHHHAGSFGDHVISLNLLQGKKKVTVTPDGTPALFRATLGGLGQTGVITDATLRLAPCPGEMMAVHERRMEDWDEFIAHLDASEATYTVGWIDATAKGRALGRGILEEAELTTGRPPGEKKARSVPFNAPSFALAAPVVRLFNKAYYSRIPAVGRRMKHPLSDFFFPLDAVHNWNRLYGKRGFHQFQCVVPLAEAPRLRAMLERIAKSGLASPLAVLKRMGSGTGGYLSFPMEGYTLAVDFPNRNKALGLISELEAEVAEAGGRVYLAKDSLGDPGRVKPMYPELSAWQAEAAKADPKGHLITDLVRRLELRSV